MSTLPFLLSVADELDNINSQSYMDDFGLGFHPHRQYYRTPTIQLSLPASTDWMQQERQQRYRSHKFFDETHNNLQTTDHRDGDGDAEECDVENAETYETNMERYATTSGPSTSAGASANGRQKYASPLNSNRFQHTDITGTTSATATATTISSTTRTTLGNRIGIMSKSGNKSRTVNANKEGNINVDHNVDADADDDNDDDDDNIDNSVRMYNLSKKCCKNYHRHAIETNVKIGSGHTIGGAGATVAAGSGGAGVGSYRLHTKCMEGNNSSSDESLQKVSSSIEFLTCFLLKRSRASSSSSSSRNAANSSGAGSSSKKS